MNKEEFISEVKASDICPEKFDEVYAEFQKYQALAMGALKAFHIACEKHGINYQLAYGSLLGAIRDGGQIPWDYDIDVFVPFIEKDRLIQALKEDLDPEYYFYCPEVDQRCRHYMMRITPKGYRSEGLHVDVFYLIGAPDDNTREFGEKCKKAFYTRFAKKVNIFEESLGSGRRGTKLFLNKLKYLFTSNSSVDSVCLKLCSMYDYTDAKKVISFDEESAKYVYDGSRIRKTKLISLDSGEFRIPEDYDYILTTVYGDYYKILPLAKRLEELLGTYNRLNYYNSLRADKH